jgi:hypothetical protein
VMPGEHCPSRLLITIFCLSQYHYSLGKSLYSITKGEVADDMLFSIADQIKHGIDNLATESLVLRRGFAKLYEISGSKAAACSDHAASCSYLELALTLLSDVHSKTNSELTLRISLRLAESRYSCGDVEKAQCILQEITPECHSLEDTLRVHALLAASECNLLSMIEKVICLFVICSSSPVVLISRKNLAEAYTLCCEVLSQLGEEIPEPFNSSQITEMVGATLNMVKSISSQDLMEMTGMDERLSISMHFYTIMGTAAFFVKPIMSFFIACRMVELTMKNGLCEYSILGFVQFAAILHSSKMTKNGIECASLVGGAAMSCWKMRYLSSGQLPDLYSVYYGFIAHHTEPLQTCADMLRQGFDIGMSLGKTGVAFQNSSLHIRTALLAGDRLPSLLEKADYYLDLTNTYLNENSKEHISIFRETISILIGKGGSTMSSHAVDVPTNTGSTQVLESIYFHRVIQTFWQGHYERCQHYIGKLIHRVTSDTWKLPFITFYHGLTSFQLMRTKPLVKLKNIAKRTIRMIKTAASHSNWNFLNKVRYGHSIFEQLNIYARPRQLTHTHT